jgi:18S rRNA (guanine1575-N7)-methyltransferase
VRSRRGVYTSPPSRQQKVTTPRADHQGERENHKTHSTTLLHRLDLDTFCAQFLVSFESHRNHVAPRRHPVRLPPAPINRCRTNTHSPPDLHYNDVESRKYTTSSRIQRIQADMTHRALDLIGLTQSSMILDVGCGSCLSGEILSQTVEEGTPAGPHVWVGFDISASMLGVALEKEVEGDLLLADAGQGVPFRPGTFDAAISISAIQWLCQAETSEDSPSGRLFRFFNQLYASLKRGGRACLQFYPKNDEQKKMVAQAAIKAGFGAGLLEDDPGTKSAKTYLVLTVGGGNLDGDITGVVRGMEGVDVMETRRKAGTMKRGEDKKGSKGWILKKKEQQKNQGKVVKASSKYTGRKRRIQF